jgi:hypothetical protein
MGRPRHTPAISENPLVAGDLVLGPKNRGNTMANHDDETMKIAIAIGAVLLIIWAIRMTIIAFK